MTIEIRIRRSEKLDLDFAHERLRLAMIERFLERNPGQEIDLGYFEWFTLKTRQKKGKTS